MSSDGRFHVRPFTANEPESVIKLRQCQPGDDADILRGKRYCIVVLHFCLRSIGSSIEPMGRNHACFDAVLPVLSRIVDVRLSKYLDCVVQQVTRH